MATGSTPAASSAGSNPSPAAEKPSKASNDLLERVARRAPHMDAEFVKKHNLPDEYLEAVASGLEPAPPYIGPNPTVDQHFTPGGWQITPKGVAPEDLPETGRVHADTASPGETRTQGQTQAMGTGLSPDQAAGK
jgi:hypothetical protein